MDCGNHRSIALEKPNEGASDAIERCQSLLPIEQVLSGRLIRFGCGDKGTRDESFLVPHVQHERDAERMIVFNIETTRFGSQATPR